MWPDTTVNFGVMDSTFSEVLHQPVLFLLVTILGGFLVGGMVIIFVLATLNKES